MVAKNLNARQERMELKSRIIHVASNGHTMFCILWRIIIPHVSQPLRSTPGRRNSIRGRTSVCMYVKY